ncbi:MAG TPA: hypothetical protein VF936_13335 [Burkholderiales bacterium]
MFAAAEENPVPCLLEGLHAGEGLALIADELLRGRHELQMFRRGLAAVKTGFAHTHMPAAQSHASARSTFIFMKH